MHKLKEDFDARATEEMDRNLIKTDEWSLNEKLALSCRILARQDQGSALAGHVTARGSTPALPSSIPVVICR